MKKEVKLTTEVFETDLDEKLYPNYMALAQAIVGKKINGEIQYPEMGQLIILWGLKGNVDKTKGD